MLRKQDRFLNYSSFFQVSYAQPYFFKCDYMKKITYNLYKYKHMIIPITYLLFTYIYIYNN